MTVEGNARRPRRARGSRIVASRFNHFIVDRLVEGALDALVRHGGDAANVTRRARARRVGDPARSVRARSRAGEEASTRSSRSARSSAASTPHFDYVAGEVVEGHRARCRSQTGVPVAFGVLTTDTIEQAIERAGTKAGNKGWDAARQRDRDGLARRARSTARASDGDRMGARSSGREAALQMLFQLEAGGGSAERGRSRSSGARRSRRSRGPRRTPTRSCAASPSELAEVDEAIRKASTNWRLERMARVDRNVLRLGAWELLQRARRAARRHPRRGRRAREALRQRGAAAPSSTACSTASPTTLGRVDRDR